MADDLDLEQILDTALASHQAGQLDLAEAGYRTVLQHDPNGLDALNLLAGILQERGDFAESTALLARALTIDPDFPEALTSLARAERAAGVPAAAAVAARRAIELDQEIAAAHFQLGGALTDLGDHAGAAEALRRAVALAPRSADALALLGMVLIRVNDNRGAAEALAAAISLDPNRIDAALVLTHLSHAYRACGDTEAAIEVARRAVALDPSLPDAQVQLGCLLLNRESDAEAVEVLRRATAMAPRSLEAQTALAKVLTRLKDFQAATEACQAALTLKPDDVGLLLDLAESLDAVERFDEALATYRQADALAQGHPHAQFGIANALARKGDLAAAAEMCRRALDTRPDLPKAWLLLGNWEAMRGRFDAAEQAYRRTLAIEPGSADALHSLAVLGERMGDDASEDAARELVDDESQPARSRAAAGFALGQLRDGKGAYNEAFEAYSMANRLLHADRAARGFVFDRDEFRRTIDGLITTTSAHTFAEAAGWGDQSELPVFIVGMPRSGSSLVEQIAASHPMVFGAGELKEIYGIQSVLGAEQLPGTRVIWDPASVRREAMVHVQRLRGLGGNATRVIDKMPDNVLYLGQIATLFPRAYIIVCKRDPRDVSLSCFFQYFQEDGMNWTDDLADCGFRAREINRLIEHWRKVLPVRILELQYETLVANLESESRRLISFLGLDWDPVCLSFHATERTVMTGSLWQVRQPLYASSVGRWKHYRRHLGSLQRELEGWIPADADDAVPIS